MTDRYRIEGSVSLTPDEEDEEKRTPGRPNAWWAEHKNDVAEAADRAATFDSAVRGVNQGPHGGAASVTPDDVTGSTDYCWCGLPFDHDWPGKDRGRKHPRELSNVSTASSERQRIERRQLRAYHDDLVDVITEAVNGYGARYRLQKNGIVLFPPDGTQGITVAARNSPRAVKSLRIWFLRHCVRVDANGENPLVADAEVLSEDEKVRHQRERAALRDERENIVEEYRNIAPPRDEAQAEPESSVTEPEWVPYVDSEGRTNEHFETDGEHYRCKTCLGTDHEYISDNARGIGGHVRMNHRDTENLHSPEAREKATESKRLNKLQARVDQAVALLGGTSGTRPEDAKKIKDLEEQVASLTKRAEDAETRLALMREALQV